MKKIQSYIKMLWIYKYKNISQNIIFYIAILNKIIYNKSIIQKENKKFVTCKNTAPDIKNKVKRAKSIYNKDYTLFIFRNFIKINVVVMQQRF